MENNTVPVDPRRGRERERIKREAAKLLKLQRLIPFLDDLEIIANDGTRVKIVERMSSRTYRLSNNNVVEFVNYGNNLTELEVAVKIRPFGGKDDGSDDVFIERLLNMGRAIDFTGRKYKLTLDPPKHRSQAQIIRE